MCVCVCVLPDREGPYKQTTIQISTDFSEQPFIKLLQALQLIANDWNWNYLVTHQLYPTIVDAVAVFVQDGLEDIADGTIGLGLDTDRLVIGQVQSKQNTTLYHHFFGTQYWNVFLQVKRLWAKTVKFSTPGTSSPHSDSALKYIQWTPLFRPP